jgi:RND family efflux transporter MFP subunit
MKTNHRWPSLPRAALMPIALLATLVAVPARAQSLGCLIVPSKVIELGSPSAGIIQNVLVDRGATVKTGQVLATLQGDVEQANVNLASTRASADADLQAALRAHEFAQRKLERTQDLFRKEFVSAQAVDQALAEAQAAHGRKAQALEQAQQAKRELAVATAQLATRTLRSPVDGVVVDLYRRSGERVEDRPILKIVTLDPLYVEVVLPATLYARIKPGLPVVVRPALEGVPALTGTVSVADRVIDPASNTFRARIVLPNADSAIPAGLRCQADFGQIATKPGGLAPATARALP